VTHKVCTKCKVEKPVEAFSKHKGKPGGLRYECKECGNANSAKWREANPDYQQRHYLANREAVLARQKAYRDNNLEQCRAKARNYRRQNKQKNAVYFSEYIKKHPEKNRAKRQRRRALELAASVYLVSRKEITKLYASNCFYCGGAGRIELDHVVPLAQGGQHSIGNLVPACMACNRSKGSKTIMQWRMIGGNANGTK
jgi:5-methylcytosine-specific restriction endonuclease McrA